MGDLVQKKSLLKVIKEEIERIKGLGSENKLKQHILEVSGSKKNINLTVQFVKGTNAEQAFILIQDITPMQELERARAEKQFSTVYFASVAHDLRTPINTVIAINH